MGSPRDGQGILKRVLPFSACIPTQVDPRTLQLPSTLFVCPASASAGSLETHHSHCGGFQVLSRSGFTHTLRGFILTAIPSKCGF